MRVCLLATEFFSHGAFGGFGALTRELARGFVARGLEVIVVMPRQPAQRPIEIIDGCQVIGLPIGTYLGLRQALPYAGIFKMIDADVYHSQEPWIATSLALMSASKKKHIITFQDPRDMSDWHKQWTPEDKRFLRQLQFLTGYRLTVVPFVWRADALFCQAKFVVQKAKRIYWLRKPPGFLPNPVDVPKRPMLKAEQPTVCFLGRWAPIKRPELFFELARRFPGVEFIATGASQPQFSERDDLIHQRYRDVRNLHFAGWTFGEAKSHILEKSWILVNTSTKECLPVSYLEAAAHKCAILSHGNADDFASEFGYWARKGDLTDFADGLRILLADNEWKRKGELGFDYVCRTHEYERVIDQHIEVYERMIGGRNASATARLERERKALNEAYVSPKV